MFASSNNTSSNSALRIELRNRQEMNNDLLEKIIALQVERQLARERELALLELVNFYRKDILQEPSAPTEGATIPEIVHASPTTIRSSDGSLSPDTSSPSRQPSPETEEGYIFEGLRALGTLLTLSTAPTALSLFQTASQAEAYQTSAVNLRQISDLVSRFASDVATLRGRCVRSQDTLVPRILKSFLADATATLNQFTDPARPNPEHPMELSLRFHGLPEMLQALCQQAWCLGPGSRGCIHTLSPEMNELMAVTLVHPGGAWKDLKRCLFAGLNGATRLEGDIFSLVGMAQIQESQGRDLLDEASWAAVFKTTHVVDIFWELLGEDSITPDYLLEETDHAGSEASLPETDQLVYEDTGSEASLYGETNQLMHGDSEASLINGAASDTSSAFVALEQAEDVLAELEFIDEGQFFDPEALQQAELALAELELHSQQTGGHLYLRAGQGANASLRSSSFIAAREDTRHGPPSPPKGPYPFLKRGDGLRRRSWIPAPSDAR